MSSFNKFIEDLERRQEIARKKREMLNQQEQHHTTRERNKLYSEKWQNSIRFPVRGKK